jgi:hypothetical protein
MRNIVELNAPEKQLRQTSTASKISAQLIKYMQFYKKLLCFLHSKKQNVEMSLEQARSQLDLWFLGQK